MLRIHLCSNAKLHLGWCSVIWEILLEKFVCEDTCFLADHALPNDEHRFQRKNSWRYEKIYCRGPTWCVLGKTSRYFLPRRAKTTNRSRACVSCSIVFQPSISIEISSPSRTVSPQKRGIMRLRTSLFEVMSSLRRCVRVIFRSWTVMFRSVIWSSNTSRANSTAA